MGFEKLFDNVVEETFNFRGGNRLVVGFMPEASTAEDSDKFNKEDVGEACEFLSKHIKYWRQNDDDNEDFPPTAENLRCHTPESVTLALIERLGKLKNSITGKQAKFR